ncbi:MAG: M14-type cytosolic carboxypeptidase [Bryobacteraceae bacterium]
MLPLLAISVVFSGFEGASLEKVETVSPVHFRCHLRGDVDQDKRNRQANWYYFRIDGARGKAVTIDLVGLPGEYNYKPNRGAVTADTLPVWSEDDKGWQHFTSAEYDAKEPRLRLQLTPRSNRVWIAHVPPYTQRNLRRLLTEYAGDPNLQVESIGRTVGQRQIPMITITGAKASAEDAARRKTIWLMFRQHAWETGSSWAAEGAIRFLLSDHPDAVAIRNRFLFRIYPLCAPDGVAEGKVRFNRYGYDLNRNWDVTDPDLMPEIHAQRKKILEWVDSGRNIDLFLSLHNTETGEYLEGPPDPSGQFGDLGQRLFDALQKHTTFAPTRPLSVSAETTTEGKPGRMTVNQGLYRDRKLPAFLMELRIASHPRLDRPPTADDRLDFGRGLVRATAQALDARVLQ